MTFSEPCPRTDDAPLFALGALDPDEASEYAEHLRSCAECRRELAGHQFVVGRLQESLAAVPAPTFDELVFASASAPARRHVHRRHAALAAALCAVAAAAVAFVVVLGGGNARPVAIATVRAELAGVRTTGVARLYNPERPDGIVRLRLADVPAAAPGTYYAVWVLPRGRTTMEAVGSFVPRSRSVELSLRLPGPGRYQAIDISIQRVGGPSRHSDRSLAGGAFAPAA